MKALEVITGNDSIQLSELPKPEIAEEECLVHLKNAALNRRDQWIREGKYPGIKDGIVLGSDGCGIVEEGSKRWIGKEVIINPNVNWGSNPEVQSPEYSILGMPVNGTFAEYIHVSEDRLIEKPHHLSCEEAAALPLAGLTAYRALFTKGQITPKQKVLITGIGGGVSQFAMQFAVAIGAEVYVTSGEDAKIQRACDLGAISGFNYRNENWVKESSQFGGYDVIIDSAGGDLLNSYLKLIESAGRIVIYGSTSGTPHKLDLFRLFWSQAQIIGSTMGNDDEFSKMVEFVSDHQLKPTIDNVFNFEDYISAFDQFKAPDHFGKIVLNIQ